MHPKFIYRQITSSLKQTAVFVACVALSLVTLVSLGGFGESVNNSLLRDARKLLAADLEVRSGFAFRQPIQEEIDRLKREDGVSVAHTYEFISVIRQVGGEETLLSELKIVEPGYPFYGEVLLQSGRPLADVLLPGRIVVGQSLLDRLKLVVGEQIHVGEATLTIADIVLSEPDEPVNFFTLGPRIMIGAADLDALDLIKPGSRVSYRTLLKVDDESRLDEIAARLEAVAEPRQERIDTFLTNQSSVQRFFENLLTFLSLIGIFTLMLAGIGIQSSLTAFLKEREETIAILRTFGATSRFVIRQYFAVAAVLGFVVASFTFIPLYQIQELKPNFIFRKESPPIPRSWAYYTTLAAIVLFFAGLVFFYLRNPQRTVYFAAGVVGLVALTTLLARLTLLAVRKSRIKPLVARQALRGLFRPRNATAAIIVTLATSLAVLFTIYLIERNLDASFVDAFPEDAPNVVLLDIQPDQRPEVAALIGGEPEFIPVISARIQAINGVVIERPVTSAETDPQMGGDGGRGQGPSNERGQRITDRFTLTYRAGDTLAPEDRLTSTETIFPTAEAASSVAQVSVDEGFLPVYPFALGDVIRFDIQGVPFEAQVASFRAHDDHEDDFTPRFTFIMREQDLIAAPQTIITAAFIDPADIPTLQNRVVNTLPNVTVINISATIDTVAELVANITTVIRFFTLFSMIAGVLIIISSVLATRFARIQEAAYFKVLGAKRAFVLRIFALENVFIGLISAVLALFLSQLAGWILVSQVFELAYVPYWGSSIILLLFTIALVTMVGLLASISILQKKPITFLREQTVE